MSENDFITHDRLNSYTGDIPDVNLTRASIDKNINNHGLKLIDLCKSSNIRNC